MPEYMFLIRYDDVELTEFSPGEYQKMLTDFNEWRNKLIHTAGLRNSGKLTDGEGKTVRLKKGKVVIDGPYCETKEALAGFFHIVAKDYNEAIEFSKECPILPLGGSIEVRELE
ncbi:MAG: YciI family protein [Ignavibacteria bacterium]|jgi:hypothetical protein